MTWLKRPGGGAKEQKLHGVRRERMKGRSSREGGSSRQSILMRKLKRRSELRRQLLAKEVGEDGSETLFLCVEVAHLAEILEYMQSSALFRIWHILA